MRCGYGGQRTKAAYSTYNFTNVGQKAGFQNIAETYNYRSFDASPWQHSIDEYARKHRKALEITQREGQINM